MIGVRQLHPLLTDRHITALAVIEVVVGTTAVPTDADSPGRVERLGAVTCGVVSTNNARPEGFEPPTF